MKSALMKDLYSEIDRLKQGLTLFFPFSPTFLSYLFSIAALSSSNSIYWVVPTNEARFYISLSILLNIACFI